MFCETSGLVVRHAVVRFVRGGKEFGGTLHTTFTDLDIPQARITGNGKPDRAVGDWKPGFCFCLLNAAGQDSVIRERFGGSGTGRFLCDFQVTAQLRRTQDRARIMAAGPQEQPEYPGRPPRA